MPPQSRVCLLYVVCMFNSKKKHTKNEQKTQQEHSTNFASAKPAVLKTWGHIQPHAISAAHSHEAIEPKPRPSSRPFSRKPQPGEPKVPQGETSRGVPQGIKFGSGVMLWLTTVCGLRPEIPTCPSEQFHVGTACEVFDGRCCAQLRPRASKFREGKIGGVFSRCKVFYVFYMINSFLN